ncbi:hypothetical protein N2152v2_009983 [Parachlorella kessleri]
MKAKGRKLKQHLSRARFGGELLVSLPLDVLELVCSSLTLDDTVALTSCCRRLWTRPDVTDSERLWGALEADFKYKTAYVSRSHAVSLSHWLARHKAAVSRLSLLGYRDGFNPARVLTGLGGVPLASLELRQMDAIGANPARALAPLAHLGGLTKLRLQDCDVQRLPRQLSALTALEVLDIVNYREGDGVRPAAFAVLAALTQLTAVRLERCGLRQLPQQLSALAASLRLLGLPVNYSLGNAVVGNMCPLHSLSALTNLDMSCCGLPRVPPQLSAMGLLHQLRLSDNGMAGARPNSWEPLRRLTCLTLLDLAECQLEYLPQQLSCLTALAELVLSGNRDLGPFLDGGGPAAAQAQPEGAEESNWQPLLSLDASLTSLDMCECNIAALPAELSSLSALMKLDLSNNVELGLVAGTAFQPLSGLVGLEMLGLNALALRCIPPQLKALPALKELQVWGNRSLGDEGPALGEQLLELSTLKRLDLGYDFEVHSSTEEVLELMRGRGVSISSPGVSDWDWDN